MLFRYLLMLLLVFGNLVPLFAQFPRGTTNPGIDNRDQFSTIDSAQSDVLVDTFKVFYFFPESFFKEKQFTDTSLHNLSHQLDPARMRTYDYQNLGVDGSPAQPLVYQQEFRRGFDIGFHQFDIYHISPDSLPFYRIERAFTNVEYDRGGDQTNSRLALQFSRNFADGVNLTLDYQRLSQLADRIQFTNQRSRNTALATGLTFQNKSGRYRAYLSYGNNKSEQEDNGGILAEPTISGNFASPSTAIVQTENATTTYRQSTLQYFQLFSLRKPEEPKAAQPQRPQLRPPGQQRRPDSLKLTGPPINDLPRLDTSALDTAALDSILAVRLAKEATTAKRAIPRDTLPQNKSGIFNKQAFFLGHSIRYQTNNYKFYDDQPTTASNYYDAFLLDDRGLRYFIDHKILQNKFFLLTYKPAELATDKAKESRGLLELGIVHRLHWIQQEPLDSTVNNLFITGKWHYLPTDFLKIETYGHLGILDNIGDFRAEGHLELDLGKVGLLRGKFINQLSEPSLIYKQHYLSQQALWQNPFKKTLETTLEATYAIPALRFSASAAYHLVNNFTYFDTLGMAQQADVPVSILQLKLHKDFTLGNFHLDNKVVLQSSSEDFVRLPELFGKHSLYYNGKWFKQVLDIRIGLDLRYTSAYFSETYQPVIGNFHLQNQQELPLLPLLDAHLSIRVTKFRAYARLENLRNLLISNPTEIPAGGTEPQVSDLSDIANWRLYYPTAFYPYPNSSGFRLGIKWRFTD